MFLFWFTFLFSTPDPTGFPTGLSAPTILPLQWFTFQAIFRSDTHKSIWYLTYLLDQSFSARKSTSKRVLNTGEVFKFRSLQTFFGGNLWQYEIAISRSEFFGWPQKIEVLGFLTCMPCREILGLISLSPSMLLWHALHISQLWLFSTK